MSTSKIVPQELLKTLELLKIKLELLKTKQVAEMLNAGERSVWRWSHSGRMPKPVRIGNAVRFKRQELEEWIQAGCPRVDGKGAAQ